SARQDSAVAIGRWPYGHSVRVWVAHCHNENPQGLIDVVEVRREQSMVSLHKSWRHGCHATVRSGPIITQEAFWTDSAFYGMMPSTIPRWREIMRHVLQPSTVGA